MNSKIDIIQFVSAKFTLPDGTDVEIRGLPEPQTRALVKIVEMHVDLVRVIEDLVDAPDADSRANAMNDARAVLAKL